MISLIKNILGIGPKTDFAALVNNGAQIIDVRTKAEYEQGHIHNAMNIPLNQLNDRLNRFKKEQSIITCCASGMRSAEAKNILKAKGFASVYNGGGWMSLKRKIG